VASDYRLSRPIAARLLGALLLLAGFGLVLLAVLVALLNLPSVVMTTGVFAAVFLVVFGGLFVTRQLSVVHLGDEGYRVSAIRGAGVTRARWTDVEDVVATTVANERCVVLRLRDGRSTTVPVRMLAGSPDAFVQDLQEHLNTGHGYRRIR
jgi:hypothetical protein